MWSLGCILAELLTGFPLLPGEDEVDQLSCIIELLGMPPRKLTDDAARARHFFSSKGHPRYCKATTIASGETALLGGVSRRGKFRGPPGSKFLKDALKGCEDLLFLDFIKRCLQWDPERRMTPSKALRHAWLRRRLPRPPDQLDKGADPSPACPSGCPMSSTGMPAPTSGSSVSRSSAKSSQPLVSSSVVVPSTSGNCNAPATLACCRLSSTLNSSRHSQQQNAPPAPPPPPQQQKPSSGTGSASSTGHSVNPSQPSSLPTSINHQLTGNATANGIVQHNNSLHSHNGGSHGSLHDSHSRSSHGSSGVSNRYANKESSSDSWR